MKTLLEDSKRDLIAKSKRSDLYGPNNRDFGKNRHQRRLKSRIATSVAEYNKIDMNKLFKENILQVNIRVNGETDVYLVTINFDGFLDSLRRYLPDEMTEEDIEFKVIQRALLDSFNHNDVKVHCTCPDWQYRQAYWATVNGINAGAPENRPSDETNPDDTKGAGCKHINLVLNNNSWMMKVASVVTNYIKYMRKHYEKLYADVIYPAIFEHEYEEPVQMDMFNKIDNIPEDEVPSNEDTIDISNKWARTKNQFKPGNKEGIRFSSPNKELDIDSINLDDNTNETTEED